MTKMKHFLRKFHIGSSGGCGGVVVTDDREHHDSQATDDSPESSSAASALVSTPSEQQPSTSTEETTSSSSVPNFSENSSNSNAIANAADYGLREEEFQVELALAISVSDRESREDTETAQIKTAKQISLGCQPSESLVDFISLQYWVPYLRDEDLHFVFEKSGILNFTATEYYDGKGVTFAHMSYSVVNYDEKVMNGFYDVHGFNSNMMPQEKMPMLVDLQSICVAVDVNYQVILVNSAVDTELRKLVEKVHLLPIKYSSLEVDAVMTILVQKIACIVVDKMGGPVNDAEEMPRKWTSRSYELKMSLNSIVLPIGCLDIGLSRHRALLFKVLADQINLPCMLVKGSYYSGTDDGAVNLIKFSNGSEYMIDLMGAPGTLIPSEVPSSYQDIKSGVTSAGDAAYPDFGAGSGSVLCSPSIHGAAKISPFDKSKLKEHCGDTLQELYNCEIGNTSLPQISEEPLKAEPIKSAVQRIHLEDISTMVANTARNPERTSASFPILNIPDLAGKDQLLEGEILLDRHCFPLTNLSNNDQAIPFTKVHLFSDVLHSPGGNDSSELLTAQKDFWRPTFAPQENFSSSATGPGNAIVGSRADPLVSAGDFLDKLEETSFCHQPNSQLSQNEQVDALLGGSADWEIPWEDLLISERIGIGSYGEVHRAEWNGTEVAVKKLMNQDISGDALVQFKCEIEIMLRLRHPNLVLFMGAVTHPPNLSILTEYLPRGSLFKLLHRSGVQIDERRRLRMAIDMAKGMNYLHTSHPVIVHRDLKTPNLLVDKNWVVKVCDFGMSRLKHHTFLSSKSTAGTAEWMAPEVLRNEPCNEKCDVYSFGVILWELATLEVPWHGMNSMQVVGAVGFQGRCLKIPDLVDPMVADIIIECWNPKPLERPSFAQILTRLKRLQHLVSPKADAPKHQL